MVLIAMPLLGSGLDVGYYAIAAQVVTVLLGVWVVMSSSTLPVLARAARDDHDRLRHVFERTIHAAFVFGVGVSVLTLVGADLAIRLLAGPEFEPATEVLQILAPTLAAGYLVTVWTLTLRPPPSWLGTCRLGVPWRLLSAVVLAAGLSILAGMLLPASTGIAVVIPAGLYAGVLLLLGAIPPELRDLLTLRSPQRSTSGGA
jgi:O-antigen/teichoic acid export membrane protein